MSDKWASPPPGLAETQHRIPAGPYLTFPALEPTSVNSLRCICNARRSLIREAWYCILLITL